MNLDVAKSAQRDASAIVLQKSATYLLGVVGIIPPPPIQIGATRLLENPHPLPRGEIGLRPADARSGFFSARENQRPFSHTWLTTLQLEIAFYGRYFQNANAL